jgi:RimJ/RimL family protein N-acetyltransferase
VGGTGTRPAPSRDITAELPPAGRAAALAAGPPPELALPAPYAARTLRPGTDDARLLTRWMSAEHVSPYWDQAWPRDAWDAELTRQLAGTFSRPLLVLAAGAPLAYLEVYRAARDVVSRHYPAAPADLGVHVAIGDPGSVGRGSGRALLRAVADGLLAADPACSAVVAEPDVRNAAAVRAFAAAAYEPSGEIDLGHKRATLVVRRR